MLSSRSATLSLQLDCQDKEYTTYEVYQRKVNCKEKHLVLRGQYGILC